MSNENTQEEQSAIEGIIKDAFSNIAYIVPPLNIAMGVVDITKAAWTLYNGSKAAAMQAKLDLILGIICVIPGAGAPIRTTFKSLLRNPTLYGPILFDIITVIIEKINAANILSYKIPINPEALLRQVINEKEIKAYFEEARKAALDKAKDSVFSRWFDVSGTINTCFNFVSNNLSDIIGVFTPIVLNSIGASKKKRANAGIKGETKPKNKKKADTPDKKPDNNKKSDTHKKPSDQKTKTSTKNNPTKSPSKGKKQDKVTTKKFNLVNAAIGGVGEHIADYYCLEHLGWGKGQWQAHDNGVKGNWTQLPNSINGGKLNERGKLKVLQPVSNDTGIDGFWRAPVNNTNKKYAVVEAKASASSLAYSPKGVGKFLGKTVDKDKSGNFVVQMSHDWIEKRLIRMQVQLPKDVRIDFSIPSGRWKSLYRRHIVFVPLQLPSTTGFEHAEALIAKIAGEPPKNHMDHSNKNTGISYFSHEGNINVSVQTARNQASTSNKRKRSRKK